MLEPLNVSAGSPNAVVAGQDGNASKPAATGFFSRFKIRPGSVAGCAFNLCSATLGAGSLSLPYAFRCSGLILALILLVLGALSTIFSIFLLVEARRLTGRQSYEELAHFLFGRRFEWLVEFAIILFCFGTAAAYIIAIGDILEPVAEAIGVPGWFNRNLLMSAFWALVMFPLSMVEKVNSLTWTSFMGVCSITFLVFAAACHAIQTISNDGWRTDDTKFFNANAQLLLGAPIVMFAFTCQVNVFSIQNELHNPTPARMSRVIVGSVCTSLTIYALMGLFGYLDFLGETPGNILKNYDLLAGGFVDIVVDMAFLAITVTVVVAFPLNIFPCRFALDTLLYGSKTATEQQDLLGAGSGAGETGDYGANGNSHGHNNHSRSRPRGLSRGSSSSIQDDLNNAAGGSNGGGNLVIDSSYGASSSPSSSLLRRSDEDDLDDDGNGSLAPAGIRPVSGGNAGNGITRRRGFSFLRGAFARHFMLTFGLCGGALAVAIALPSLNFAFQLLGGLCSSFLCFALPGMYMIRIARNPERFVSPELGQAQGGGGVGGGGGLQHPEDEDRDDYASPLARDGLSHSSAGSAEALLPNGRLIGGYVKPSYYYGSWALIISGSLLGAGATAVTIAGLWVDSLKEED